MDSITQAVLGASLGEALLGRRLKGMGAALGGGVATLPDLDVALLPFFDTLGRVSVHRGYSHSLLFSVVAAGLLTWLFGYWRLTREVPAWRLWLFSWLALITHYLLDVMNTYGTQLFLPFSNRRVSLDSITVVDPVYTLPLLAGLVLAVYVYRNAPRKRAAANYAGMAISSVYLVLTLSNKAVIGETFRQALATRGVQAEKLLTVPVTAGNYSWRGAAIAGDSLYLGGFNQFARKPVRFEVFAVNDHLLDQVGEDMAGRLRWFSKGHHITAGTADSLRFYNLQVDMQGPRNTRFGRAPTAWYMELNRLSDGSYGLGTAVHRK